MQLLPTEEILVSSNSDKIILTNRRVHLSNKEWGHTYQITIFLKNISSVEILHKSNPVYLVLAAAGFLFGILALQSNNGNATASFGGIMIAIVFLILWFSSQSQVIIIASNGGSKITFPINRLKTTQAEEFIDRVMLAKSNTEGYILDQPQPAILGRFHLP